MAEMRLRARPIVLLAAVLLLALPAVAGADIKPIPKPDNPVTPATPPAPPPPPATPVSKPDNTAVTPPSPPATPPAPPATPPAPPATPPSPPTIPETIVVAVIPGGHDQSNAAVPGAPPPPDPTPIALVAASEPMPSHGSSTPAWKLALLALLAAGEAFLVVRLVRHRPGGPGGELTPAQ
jgi:hypothetical protein